MKKAGILIVLSMVLIFSSFNIKAYAAGQTDSKTIKEELKQIDKQTSNIELVYDLPKNTPTIKYKSIEDFKKAVAEYEKNLKNKKQTEEEYFEDPKNIDTNSFTVAAASATKTGLKQLTWFEAENLRYVIQWWLPNQMWMDIKYTYTGSGKSKKFVKVTKVKSHSSGIPSNWYQTLYTYSRYDKNRGVKITITGYHLVGANVAGQSVGLKVNDKYTKKFHF